MRASLHVLGNLPDINSMLRGGSRCEQRGGRRFQLSIAAQRKWPSVYVVHHSVRESDAEVGT